MAVRSSNKFMTFRKKINMIFFEKKKPAYQSAFSYVHSINSVLNEYTCVFAVTLCYGERMCSSEMGIYNFSFRKELFG